MSFDTLMSALQQSVDKRIFSYGQEETFPGDDLNAPAEPRAIEILQLVSIAAHCVTT